MFDKTLGKYTDSDYATELEEDTKPYHTMPFTIPTIHKLTLKKEGNRLIRRGV